jgi:hypothetical protein
MMKNENVPIDGSPGFPYIEFGSRACYKEEASPTEESRARGKY